MGDFPDIPAVGTLHFQRKGHRFSPGWEMEIPHAMQGKKKKKLKNSNCRKAHWHVIQESIFLQAAVLETQ